MKKKLVAVLVGLTVLGLVGCKENEQVELPLATPTAGVTEDVVPTEIPTLTEVPVPTEIPTPTEVPVPTEMPAPTATPVPTEAPVPTATSTPVTTLTEAPAPTATATPVPTATPAPTATPIPTATPAPTATPVPTETPVTTETPVPTVKIREVKSKELLEDGEIFVQSGGGVIITKKDGMYGAVNMDGEELVKHTYSSWWSAPNKDGQFALVNEEAVVCFDAKGRVIYTIENLNRLYINEGYITYIYSVKNEGANAESRPYHTRLGVYDIKKKMLLDIEQPTPNVEMVTPVVDGKFYVTWAYYDGTEIKEVDVKTLEQRDVQSDWWCKFYNPQGKYGAIMANLFGNHWVGLLGVDGKEEYRVDILEMIAMYGIPSNNGCNYNVISYSEDGTTYYNRGMQVVIYIKSNDDGSEHYFLTDFSKAKVEENKIENEYNFEAT